MSGHLATFLCFAGIFGLYWLDRDPKARTSWALLVPTAWLAIDCSRALSQWLAAFGLGVGAGSFDNPDQYLDGSPVDRAGFVFLMTFGLVILVQRREKIAKMLSANWPIVLFFLYCALSALWSDYPGVTFKRWFKAVGDLMMVAIVLTEADRIAATKRVMAWVGFLLIPFSILFIKYFGALGRGYSRGGKTAYVGVTTNKNLLGMMTLVFGLATVWRLLLALRKQEGKRKFKPIIAQGVLLAMAIWLFLMADSATSLSCFAIASALMLVTGLGQWSRKRALVSLMVVAAVSVSLVALFVMPTMLATVGRDSTLTGRTEIWNQVLGIAGSPWVGTGFESFWLGKRLEALWDVYYFHLNEAHNGYLELYLTLGWIGLGLFAAILWAGYRNILTALRREPDLGRLRLAYFVVALIYNCTESATRMGNPIWIMLLMVVLAVPVPSVARASVPLGLKRDRFPKPQPEIDNRISTGHRISTGQRQGIF